MYDFYDHAMKYGRFLKHTFEAIYPNMLLTRFGKNAIKHVEENAKCEKKEERDGKKVISQAIPPNLMIMSEMEGFLFCFDLICFGQFLLLILIFVLFFFFVCLFVLFCFFQNNTCDDLIQDIEPDEWSVKTTGQTEYLTRTLDEAQVVYMKNETAPKGTLLEGAPC